MLQFCANLNFLFTEHPFLERFAAAAEAGFRTVELLNPYEAPAAEIAQRLAATGLKVALLNTPAGNPAAGERGLTALDGRTGDFEAALARALAYAQATGCRQIHLLAGLLHHGARRKVYVSNLKKAARLAAAAGVKVLIEPINRRDVVGYFLNTTEEARAIIYEVGEPNLGLQFDLYHRQIEQGNVAAAIEEFGALALHYQIASPPDRGEPDRGELDYRYLFERIDASGFAGHIGLEYRPRAGTLAGLKWMAACGVELA
jgi:hydroxypyruvate isomerase